MEKTDAFLDQPQAVFLLLDDNQAPEFATRTGDTWGARAVAVQVKRAGPDSAPALAITVHCPQGGIARVGLRWNFAPPPAAVILGDHWERGYGDLQWRPIQPERVMPWYFAIHTPADSATLAVGVQTAAAAICSWMVDAKGVTLWLDLHNGGTPCIPGDRQIAAATIVALDSAAGEGPQDAIRRLCTKMCDKPRLAPAPVCGSNNWYYAYGRNFDSAQVLRDGALLAELAKGHANKPFCVVDAGWSPGGVCPGGPWTAGIPGKFPDMPRLAEEIKKLGVRPGIWIRPTALTTVNNRNRLRAGPQPAQEKALDLTLPENIQGIKDDVARMHFWGYELIKHDFSTYDATARWGFEMNTEMTTPGWHYNDRSLTNAEIIFNAYKAIREGAGDSLLLGCNTIGHLGAGLFELQRAGDDTSGQLWERTRKMGVNTLAYRLPQNKTFFGVDADCCAHTEKTPWEKDKQFLDLVARSGTALFVSTDPTKITPEVKTAMTEAMQIALSGGTRDFEPVDWIWNTGPTKWRIDGKEKTYDWTEAAGTWPLKS